jgi:hypothetical protein
MLTTSLVTKMRALITLHQDHAPSAERDEAQAEILQDVYDEVGRILRPTGMLIVYRPGPPIDGREVH